MNLFFWIIVCMTGLAGLAYLADDTAALTACLMCIVLAIGTWIFVADEP